MKAARGQRSHLVKQFVQQLVVQRERPEVYSSLECGLDVDGFDCRVFLASDFSSGSQRLNTGLGHTANVVGDRL